MRKGPKKKAVKQIIIVIDFLLLVLFLAQSLAIGCLIAFGYIPISADWANQKLQNRQFDGFRIQAEGFRWKLWQKFELIAPKIYHNEIEDPILEATSIEIDYGFKESGSYQLNANELVVTNGTLALPAIFAPDGKRTKVLEHITFHLSPNRHSIYIDSFVGKHEDIYLRGSLEWPITRAETPKKTSIQQIFRLIATALKEKAQFSSFVQQPTLEFDLSTRQDNSTEVSLKLSCEQLKHPKITGSSLSLGANFFLNNGQLNAQAPLILQARRMHFDDLDTSAEDIVAHVTKERWPSVFKGFLPRFEVSAYRLVTGKVELNAPRIMVEPSAFPVLEFSGTTCGLQGSAVFSGAFNSMDKSGEISAHGGIDIYNLIPQTLIEKLPKLEFGAMPYYSFSIDFNQGFDIRNVNFHAKFNDLTVDSLNFDNIIAEGYYSDKIIHFENLHADRDQQWVDGSYYQDIQTMDFKIHLIGSVHPQQYNSLLPRWWSVIFKDLHFDSGNPGLGDFAIQGNFKEPDGTTLFGHVRTTNLAYREAFFDTCELIVRGGGNYVEIHDITASSGGGKATGKLGFTSAAKDLVSVRYAFDGSLPIEIAPKALGGVIAEVLGNFELFGLPDFQVQGVFFNDASEEYTGRDTIYLQAKAETPLKFQGTPLDHLKLKLIGQDSRIYLRDVQFGYAGGTADAIADILPAEGETTDMCFKMSLKNANQAKAIQNLPGSDKTGSAPEDPARALGLVDLNLHARGPLTDIYGFEGYGAMSVRNEALGSIQMLGALSELLKNTSFNFTSFNLNHMDVIFQVDHEQLVISNLEINGPRTRIWADGTFQLPDQALDMDVKVSLFANSGSSGSAMNAIGRAIASPLPNLLSFKLTGTVQDQKVRSKFDPRNLIQ